MDQVFVAFAGEKTRQYMTDVFQTTDITVAAACGTGMEILSCCRKHSGGVVLCGYSLYDMSAEELYESLPKGYSMIVLAEESQLEDISFDEIVRLKAPVHQAELLETVNRLFAAAEAEKAKIPQRSDEDKQLIAEAKQLLMDRNTMSEKEAYRFIQKKSMDMGAKMVQTARKILEGQICI